MKRKLHLFILLTFACLHLAAQQTPQYSLYMLNQFGQNPAYAGLDNTLSATGVYRSQWLGLAGAPVTQIMSAHMPLNVISSGIGIQFENDVVGASQRTAATFAYSYHVELNRSSRLSIGLSGGLIQQSLDGALFRTPEGTYEPDQNIIIHNDETLPIGIVSTQVPTFSAGVFYQAENLEMGLGVLNLQESTANFTDLSLKLRRSYYLSASYNIELTRTLILKPSVQVKSDIVQTQIEASTLVRYKDNFFLGASYRGFTPSSQDALVALGGFKLNEKWTIGYAYDITLSALKTANNGSHEILLNYNFGKPIGQGVPPKIIYNPRF